MPCKHPPKRLLVPVLLMVLLMVLVASASYIVAPSIVRYAIPEAHPGICFSMALALTFPFNIMRGIPLYFLLVKTRWGCGLWQDRC